MYIFMTPFWAGGIFSSYHRIEDRDNKKSGRLLEKGMAEICVFSGAFSSSLKIPISVDAAFLSFP